MSRREGAPIIESWGEEYIPDLRKMGHGRNFVCGFPVCPAYEEGSPIDLTERIVGVDASGNTPGKYADEHDPNSAWIKPPVYILRCPKCTRRSWVHSSGDLAQISAKAKAFREKQD